MKLTFSTVIFFAISFASLSNATQCTCGPSGSNVYTENDLSNAEEHAHELAKQNKTLEVYPKPLRKIKNADLRERCGETGPYYEFPLRPNNGTYNGNGTTHDKILLSGVLPDGGAGVGTFCGCITVGTDESGDSFKECMYQD